MGHKMRPYNREHHVNQKEPEDSEQGSRSEQFADKESLYSSTLDKQPPKRTQKTRPLLVIVVAVVIFFSIFSIVFYWPF